MVAVNVNDAAANAPTPFFDAPSRGMMIRIVFIVPRLLMKIVLRPKRLPFQIRHLFTLKPVPVHPSTPTHPFRQP
jgi:hypothetical protein